MTRGEAVQAVYAWACSVKDRGPKAGMVMLYVAGCMRSKIEEYSVYANAWDDVNELLGDWRRQKIAIIRREGNPGDLVKAIDLVTMILDQVD